MALQYEQCGHWGPRPCSAGQCPLPSATVRRVSVSGAEHHASLTVLGVFASYWRALLTSIELCGWPFLPWPDILDPDRARLYLRRTGRVADDEESVAEVAIAASSGDPLRPREFAALVQRGWAMSDHGRQARATISAVPERRGRSTGRNGAGFGVTRTDDPSRRGSRGRVDTAPNCAVPYRSSNSLGLRLAE